jgi:proteasome accessory factor B
MYCRVADVLQRVLTVSRKTERLVNLTIALLATKRFLTKSEIFNSVEGYEGSNESKERMFERDKDDLRSLGIEIEVGSFDPLFNDEAGYRIKRESYELNLGEISPLEISLISLATTAWEGASLSDVAQRAFVKLSSLGIPTDELDLPGLAPVLPDAGNEISLLAKAISERRSIKFSYLDAQLNCASREIVPTGISSRNGFWYVTGVDQNIQEFRTFRLDRIEGAIALGKVQKDFEIPEDSSSTWDIKDTLVTQHAIIDVRHGKGYALRALAIRQKELGEWDQLTIPILNLRTLASLVLWHCEDALVQEPIELRNLVISQLHQLVKSHG